MQVAVGLQHRYSRPPMDSRFAAAELYDCVPEPDTPSVLPPLIGHSAVFSRVRHDIACLAAIDAPAVIGGEPGTGKSLLARAVHAASSRASGPFVAVPCARLPETLLEIELFGCVKGSVVGARATGSACSMGYTVARSCSKRGGDVPAHPGLTAAVPRKRRGEPRGDVRRGNAFRCAAPVLHQRPPRHKGG
jgi:hypothetical protein